MNFHTIAAFFFRENYNFVLKKKKVLEWHIFVKNI